MLVGLVADFANHVQGATMGLELFALVLVLPGVRILTATLLASYP